MNLIDSSCWLEYFTDSKNAKIYTSVIEDIENVIISTINIYEVFRKVLKERDENTALEIISIMMQCQIIDVTQELSLKAAELSILHKLSMADSIILSTAKLNNATLWTQDSDFKEIQGVKYFKKK